MHLLIHYNTKIDNTGTPKQEFCSVPLTAFRLTRNIGRRIAQFKEVIQATQYLFIGNNKYITLLVSYPLIAM